MSTGTIFGMSAESSEHYDLENGQEIAIIGFTHQGYMLHVVWCDDYGYIREVPAHFVRMPAKVPA